MCLPFGWYSHGMRTTIDKAGRLVIPKGLRERIGLTAGEVDVYVDGATLRVAPVAGDDLTEREVQVLEGIARGESNKAIGDELGISEATVKSHVNSILAKLEARDRTDAAMIALKRGLIY